MRAPEYHEWERWNELLWRCHWCDGFLASEKQPDKNATAMDRAAAEESINNAKG